MLRLFIVIVCPGYL